MVFEKKQDYYVPTENFIPTQPNPTEKNDRSTKGDCAIRALANGAGITWLEAFDLLTAEARRTFNVPSDITCFRGALSALGYTEVTPKVVKGKKRLTVEGLAKKNKHGRYIVQVANHFTAIVEGKIRDTWNTSNKCVYRYWTFQE